jgi:hypothetical protein
MIAGYVGHGGPPLAATADILALVSADGARIRRPRRVSLLNAAGNADPRRHESTPRVAHLLRSSIHPEVAQLGLNPRSLD